MLWYVATVKFRVPAPDAEEILQAAAISLITVGTQVVDARAWLIAAVCNGCRHYWRRMARVLEVEGTSIAGIPEPACAFTTEQLHTAVLVREVLRLLPPKSRDVLRLHYLHGLTDTELARHYGTTPGYARKLITRGLRRARRILDVLRAGGSVHR